ncbi:hypothetical protein A2U01_0076877, partial [Trifolium medium]|nr:hypothetical protein [Trifolium medium]
KFDTLLWVLWNNRNNSVWNDVKEEGQQLGIKALSMWNGLWAVQVQEIKNQHREQDVQSVSW